jgi:hypothetical protein
MTAFMSVCEGFADTLKREQRADGGWIRGAIRGLPESADLRVNRVRVPCLRSWAWACARGLLTR